MQWFLRARIDLRADLEIDAALRHVGALPDPQVAAYSAFDLRLGWRPRDSIELAISARNLFDPSHPEFGNALTASEIERSVLMSATWQF